MSNRRVLWLLAVVVGGSLVAYVFAARSEWSSVGLRPDPGRATPSPDGASAAPTTLAAAPRTIEATPSPTPTAVTAPKPEAPSQGIEELLADMRREVEPGYWATTPGASLQTERSIVIARAAPDVLDTVGAWLAVRRARDAEPDSTPGNPVAAEGLRGVMRQMLDRHVQLEAAARLLRVEPKAALELLDRVEKEEPDNRALEALRLEATSPREATTVLPPRRGSLETWLLLWPSVSTYARWSELRQQAGPAAAVKTGAELRDLLRRGRLTVQLAGDPLWVAVRRLQIEAFVDITLDPEAGAALEAKLVTLDEVDRSLDAVLDSLLAQLPAGHRWTANRRSIEITKREDAADPPLRIRYFDVRDLLGVPSPATDPAKPGAAPPTPPLYTEPSSE